MRRKVTIVTETKGYWHIEDVTRHYEDIVEFDGKEKADQYFSVGEFNEAVNGHYSYGFLESLGQSDYAPYFLYEEGIIKIIVEDPDANA